MRASLLIVCALLRSDPRAAEKVDLLHALDLVRAQHLGPALTALEKLCPVPIEEVAKAADRDVACQVRMYAWVETNKPRGPKATSRVYWLAGDQAHKRGDLGLGEALLNVAVQRDPDNAMNWHSIGLVYKDEGKRDLAIPAFQRSLKIDPREPYTMYWLASTLIDDGQLEEAERVLSDILEIDPSHARVWFRRGEIYMIRNEYKRAIEAFETAKKKGVPRKHVAAKIRECERLLGKQ